MFIPLILFAGAVMALMLALTTRTRRRRRMPGAGTFVWLMLAIAAWCATSAIHAIVGTVALRILVAKVQYVAICAVPPLWLFFIAEYADAGWISNRRIRRAFSILPVATMAMAATNEWHEAVWTGVTIMPSGVTVYAHGWWFWLAASYNYLLLIVGSALLVRALRRSPPLFSGQLLALIVAAMVPWAGNVLYLTSQIVPGLDFTPIAFTLSGLLFAWGLYGNHLFDLVLVARDMVVDSLGDAVVVLDPERRILDMNAVARTLIRRETRWLGRSIDAVLPVLRGVPLEPTSGIPVTALATDASEDTVPRYYEVRIMPVRARSGRFAAWAVIVRDVTDEHRAAAERDAFQARAQEQQRRESLSLLAGGLAHDFNNLLAGIVGNADLLALNVPPSSDMGSSIGAILLGAQRAADLVSKMLAYAGERHGSIDRVDLDRLVYELLDLLRASAARHCTLEYRGEPVTIDADPTQIRQVAMNLIINAAEAVDEGTGLVTVTVGRALLSARQLADVQFGHEAAPGCYAFLEVRDNGHGMDDETQRRMFNPFFTTKPSGHGLGLAAVQGIVRGHRGAMTVSSQAGAGSCFKVWFPSIAMSASGLGGTGRGTTAPPAMAP